MDLGLSLSIIRPSRGGGSTPPVLVPTSLSVTTQPSASATAGAAFAQQPVVRVLDQYGDPMAASGVGVEATLSGGQPGAALVGVASAVTDENGVATFLDLGIGGLLDTDYVVSFGGLGTPVPSNPVDLDTPGPVSASQSSLASNKAALESTEDDVATVTVTVRDAYGNPIPGIAAVDVVLSVDDVTGATVSAALSSLSCDKAGIAADDTELATVTVTVLDIFGNPVVGASVVLDVSGTGETITQPGVTNGAGVTTGTFRSPTPGIVTVSATANGVLLNDTAEVAVGFVLAQADFEDDTLGDLVCNWSPQQVTVIADPTPRATGKVAEITYSPPVAFSQERAVTYIAPAPRRYGYEIWCRAKVYFKDTSGTDPDYSPDHNRKWLDWQGQAVRMTLNVENQVLKYSLVKNTTVEFAAGLCGIAMPKDTWLEFDVRMVLNSADGVADGILSIHNPGDPTPLFEITNADWINEASGAFFRNFHTGFQLTIPSGWSGAYQDVRYVDDVIFSTAQLP